MLAQLILRAAKPCGADANYTNFFSHLRPVETQNLSKLNTMMLASMVEVPPNLSKILRLKSRSINFLIFCGVTGGRPSPVAAVAPVAGG